MPQTRHFKDRPCLHTHITNASEKKKRPSGPKTGEKMSDSCHIPSDKEVRYARSEVKLQEQSAFCRKWEQHRERERTALSTIPTIVRGRKGKYMFPKRININNTSGRKQDLGGAGGEE